MKSNDMISRAAALEVINAVKGVVWSQSGKVLCGKMFSQIKDLPAVDAVPVVHGRWSEKRWMTEYDWGVINHRAIVCSACKGEIADGERTRYCPNCGAKMDGEWRDGDEAD